MPLDPHSAERRILGHVDGEHRNTVQEIEADVRKDPATPEAANVASVLADLVNSGLVQSREDGTYARTAEGDAELSGPIPNEPPPLEGAALDAAHRADAELAEKEADLVASTEVPATAPGE